MIRNADGTFLSSISEAKQAPNITLKMQDGELLIDKLSSKKRV